MRSRYTLGYSGLNDYVGFKNKNVKNLSERESLVGQGMDAAAALIKDGRIVAAVAEERFTGEKHTGHFPKNAIESCLKRAGIDISQVDQIAHNFNYEPFAQLFKKDAYGNALYNEVLSNDRQVQLFQETFGVDVADKFKAYEHHSCHAAYTYYTSGFDQSLVVVADGLGEYNSISVYEGKGRELTLLKSYGPLSSLGMLYSGITDYLGFLTNSDEYKIMGLAAYGDPKVYRDLLAEVIELRPDGEVLVPNILPKSIKDPRDRETYDYFKQWLSTKISLAREPGGEITEAQKGLTAALQERINQAMLHIVSHWQQKTGIGQLCMSGGVALNCVASGYIASKKIFKQLFIAPAAADDGTAIGAAMRAMAEAGDALDASHYIDMPFYGPEIEVDDAAQKAVADASLEIKEVTNEELVKEVCGRVVKGQIVAWAQGGMEFGPRALGHRSILADPREYEMRERLNRVTKQRENFRPFAPIVKEEDLTKYFEAVDGVVYKHMLVNVNVREEDRDKLQAIAHVDGTARVQAVSRKELPVLWDLLNAVEKETGMPILLNTSFNLKSMPIVCTGTDAVGAYVNSDIDLLVINNTLLIKQGR